MRPETRRGRGGIELIEEAVHWLRRAPAGVLASYYLGTGPFAVGLLYFWADMSRSAFAEERCAASALGLALLFVWMKCWQTVFAGQVRALLTGEAAPAWSLRRLARLLVAQAFIQPTGLVVLPVALVLTLPFGWAFAYYQSLTAVSGRCEGSLRQVSRAAWQQARLWPGQNHQVLSVFLIFGLFVWLNLLSGVVFIPQLLRALFGVESVFTYSPHALFNTTLMMALCAMTYLCVDPILKTVYALRCFYGESLRSGQDLKAELKRFASLAKVPTAGVVTLVFLCSFTALSDQVSAAGEVELERQPPPTLRSATVHAGVAARDLDRSIEQVLERREFTWRMPREAQARERRTDKGFLRLFFEEIFDFLRRSVEWLGRQLDRLFEKLFGRSRTGPAPGSGMEWLTSLQGLFFLVVMVLACALAVLLLRLWKRGRPGRDAVLVEAIQPAPDLTDESVGADTLPEDGWIRLARELAGRGELRLALRAFYLSSLAHLAARGLISLAKFKSNQDYRRELVRRRQALPELLGLFGGSVEVFDRVWYGRHEVTAETVDQFAANVERIKAC
jgi:hypothetical protein